MSDLNKIYNKGLVSERFKSELEVEFENKLNKELSELKDEAKVLSMELELIGMVVFIPNR
jgi:hypothetical protein